MWLTCVFCPGESDCIWIGVLKHSKNKFNWLLWILRLACAEPQPVYPAASEEHSDQPSADPSDWEAQKAAAIYNCELTFTIYDHFTNVLKLSLIQPLKEIAVVSGQTARFECIVQCEDTPEIRWEKDGRVLAFHPPKHLIEYRNGVCRLTISHAAMGKHAWPASRTSL